MLPKCKRRAGFPDLTRTDLYGTPVRSRHSHIQARIAHDYAKALEIAPANWPHRGGIGAAIRALKKQIAEKR